MKELKPGVYIAQGKETNVLINVQGNGQFMEIVSAIDLNAFYKDGTVKKLDKTSIEVVDIMSFQESYNFEAPSLTDAVKSAGLAFKIEDIDPNGLSQSEEEITKCSKKLKELDSFYDRQTAETKMKLWLKHELGYSLSQGDFIIKKLRQKIATKY